MNKERRKQIDAVLEAVNKLISGDENPFTDLADKVDEIKDDEQSYYDNMPEGLQNGAKGDAAQDAISALEEAASALREIDEAMDKLSYVAEQLETAKGE